MKHNLKEIYSFRLGYPDKRPYPWRWTTPVVLGMFFVISPFLAAINEAHLVPLSAYNIIEQATYRPNDTLPSLPLSNFIPSILQTSAGEITPQILTVGDVLVLNGSIFNYTIVEAFDDPTMTTPVSSFSYYNNPLSDGCDVGTVTCHIPTFFYLSWSASNILDPSSGLDDVRNIPGNLIDYFEFDFSFWFSDEQIRVGNDSQFAIFGLNDSETQLSVGFTVHPCCNCDAALAGSPLETTSLLQPPCSLNPVGFIVTGTESTLLSGHVNFTLPINTPASVSDVFGVFGNLSDHLGVACQNVLQAVYHLVRLDLGLVLENQIYNSPEMFDRTLQSDNLSDIRWPDLNLRSLTTNATLMAAWQKTVELFKSSDRVPVMQYLRSTPRIKPLGSAITSVFVSTFAMLSALWTIFSIVAGALAALRNDNTRQDEHTPSPSDPQCMLDKLEDGAGRGGRRKLAWRTSQDALEQMAHHAAHVERSLACIKFVLRKHGLMHEDLEDPEDEIETIVSQGVPRSNVIQEAEENIYHSSTEQSQDHLRMQIRYLCESNEVSRKYTTLQAQIEELGCNSKGEYDSSIHSMPLPHLVKLQKF
ncbi:hypothetical protein GGX14DRAFT_402173 [Mycena pura]|uniref:Uncharacterized protein n=1 Tax=Mycena pura TaxID=153505 RepID=A0AAD6UYR8_9AGAR|nr:hypothetical protein GGX14DRAFT_402173 [Mycena pura]